MRARHFLLATIAMAAMPTFVTAQDWRWQGRVDPSQVMEVKGINGSISAIASNGDQVEVEAVVRAKGDGDVRDVRMVTLPHAGGITICAIYVAPAGREPNQCTPGGNGNSNVQSRVEVEFLVKVPRGTRFVGRTVNGDVALSDMTADAKGYTVNGNVDIQTTGIADASTVNGSIRVSMGRADWTEPLHFSTVNGDIIVQMPADVETELRLSTLSGNIQSDFPVTVGGEVTSHDRKLNGVIGRGGRTLSVSTVNGYVQLRRN